MSAQQLLDKLKSLGKIDAEVLAKIQRRVESSKKEVSAKAVMRYLVEKKQLTQAEAKALLKAPPEKPQHEELVVNAPPADVGDTNDLLLDPSAAGSQSIDKSMEVEIDKSMEVEIDKSMEVEIDEFQGGLYDRDATRVDYNQDAAPVDEIVEVQPRQVDDIDRFDAVDQGYDPLAGPFDQAMEVSAVATDDASSGDGTPGFSGKKDRSKQWESKWPFIGFGTLGFLLLACVGLYWIIFSTSAEQMFNKAQENFKANRWSAAIEGYEKFIKTYPADAKAGLAKVRKANAVMRTFYDQRNWAETLNTAKNVLPEISEEKDFPVIREELAVMLPSTARNLAEKAKNATDLEEKKSTIALSQEMMEVVDNVSYIPPSMRKLDYVERVVDDQKKLVDDVQFEIEREAAFQQGLIDMKELTTEGKTEDAAQLYHALTRDYPSLKARQPLTDAMLDISKRESQLVNSIDIDLKVATTEAESVGKSILLATGTEGQNIGGLEGVILPYLLDGVVYAVRGSSGQILWSRDVGFSTRVNPLWIDSKNRTDLILVNEGRNEILRVNAVDGSLVWRTAIGESFTRPAIKNFFLFVTTHSGKLMRLNLDSGAGEVACQLPQGVTVGPVVTEDLPFVYQVGSQSNLYVLSEEDLTCREVFYLGHNPKTVDIEPIFLAGHLCVTVNFANHSKMRILGFEERGLKLKEMQQPVKVTDGMVTVNAVRYGRWAILISETGDIRMLELVVRKNDDEELEVRLNPVIAGQYRRTNGYANYVLAQSGNLWVANRGLTRFRIQKSKQQFAIGKTSNVSDAFLGPMELHDDTLISLRRRYNAALATASGMDRDSHQEVWRTDFGAALAGAPVVIEGKIYGLSSQGDLFELNAEAETSGYVGLPTVRATTTDQNLQFNHVETLSDGKVVLVGPSVNRMVLCYDPNRALAENSLSTLATPADKPSCRPIGLGKYLVVCSREGQAIRIDPMSGGPMGSPFQPSLDPNEDVTWRRPVAMEDQESFVIADAKGLVYHVRADGDNALIKESEFKYEGSIESPVVRIGETVFAVGDSAQGAALMSFSLDGGLAMTKSQPLETDYESDLVAAGDLLIMRLASNQLVAFDKDLALKWTVDVGDDKLAGAVVADGDRLLAAFESGRVLVLNPADGSEAKSIDVGKPLASAPTIHDGKIYIAGQNGSVHVLDGNQ